jgi:hypothetical protein
MDRATPAYIAQQVPHPEVLSRIGGTTLKGKTAAPFKLGMVSAGRMAGGIDIDSQAGLGAYSLQDNVFFTGPDGDLDSVQFTDQTNISTDNLCVWQVDVDTQSDAAVPRVTDGGVHLRGVEGGGLRAAGDPRRLRGDAERGP